MLHYWLSEIRQSIYRDITHGGRFERKNRWLEKERGVFSYFGRGFEGRNCLGKEQVIFSGKEVLLWGR